MTKLLPITFVALVCALGFLYLENFGLERKISELIKKNTELEYSLKNAESKINLLSQNSYDMGEIKRCMYRSGIRSQAIHQSIYSNAPLTPAERHEYANLLPVAEKYKGSSSQEFLFMLISESAKIDDECLEYAKRVISG